MTLTIPDNEAFTARETLCRLGIPVAHVERADIWTFTIDEVHAAALRSTLATMESIFNPNKHRLEERAGSHPREGEVWIAPHDERGAGGIGRRAIAGVSAIRRRVAWRLMAAGGANVDPAMLDRAVETFLCNPAFQKAIR
ncbi:MAG: hypothetical protein ABR591_02400 [Candidatus Velthaea sp.]